MGQPSDLRRVHRSLVLGSIFSTASSSRTRLAQQTGLSVMAISRITRELIDAGLIEEVGKRSREGNPGRRQTGLRICAGAAHVVGLVISAFGHEVALFDALGTPLARRKLSFEGPRGADEAVEIAARAVTDLLEAPEIEASRVLGIGIAIAAFVETATGTVVRAPYLGWQQLELGQRLSERTGLPVVVENIADAINLAEQAEGAARGIPEVFLAHVSVTCGASYTHQGTLIRGANYAAGQVGHLPAGDGPLICSCGATTCLNTRASGWSVLAGLGRIDSVRFQAERIESYAEALMELIDENPRRGEPEGDALFRSGRSLGRALRDIALIVDPNVIVLAGKLSEASAYVEGCESIWSDAGGDGLYRKPELIVGQVAPIRAAGQLALDRFVYSPGLDLDRLASCSAAAGTTSAS